MEVVSVSVSVPSMQLGIGTRQLCQPSPSPSGVPLDPMNRRFIRHELYKVKGPTARLTHHPYSQDYGCPSRICHVPHSDNKNRGSMMSTGTAVRFVSTQYSYKVLCTRLREHLRSAVHSRSLVPAACTP
ncbi:hypothetical protein LX36DRAFT_179155 [Colletotrichum falcatum]|nr:hypothetical protein LX36DRAFT_179155 [Colletotrichum falcatum]